MPLTEKEISSRMKKFHDEFQNAWKNSNLEKMVSMYHPEATLIAKGFWMAHGQKGWFFFLIFELIFFRNHGKIERNVGK